MKQKYFIWAIIAVVIAAFLNRTYPFTTSPLWPWNRQYRNTGDVQYSGSGYGSSDSDF